MVADDHRTALGGTEGIGIDHQVFQRGLRFFRNADLEGVQALRSADQQSAFHGLVTEGGDIVRKQGRVFLIVVRKAFGIRIIHADAVLQAADPDAVEGIEIDGGGRGAHRAVEPLFVNVVEDVILPNAGDFVEFEALDRGIPLVPVGLIPHEEPGAGGDPVLDALVGAVQAHDAVNLAVA